MSEISEQEDWENEYDRWNFKQRNLLALTLYLTAIGVFCLGYYGPMGRESLLALDNEGGTTFREHLDSEGYLGLHIIYLSTLIFFFAVIYIGHPLHHFNFKSNLKNRNRLIIYCISIIILFFFVYYILDPEVQIDPVWA